MRETHSLAKKLARNDAEIQQLQVTAGNFNV